MLLACGEHIQKDIIVVWNIIHNGWKNSTFQTLSITIKKVYNFYSYYPYIIYKIPILSLSLQIFHSYYGFPFDIVHCGQSIISEIMDHVHVMTARLERLASCSETPHAAPRAHRITRLSVCLKSYYYPSRINLFFLFLVLLTIIFIFPLTIYYRLASTFVAFKAILQQHRIDTATKDSLLNGLLQHKLIRDLASAADDPSLYQDEGNIRSRAAIYAANVAKRINSPLSRQEEVRCAACRRERKRRMRRCTRPTSRTTRKGRRWSMGHAI